MAGVLSGAIVQGLGGAGLRRRSYADRLTPVGLPWEQLPRIDAVVISHDHYDHLDAHTSAVAAEHVDAGAGWAGPMVPAARVHGGARAAWAAADRDRGDLWDMAVGQTRVLRTGRDPAAAATARVESS